MCFLKARSRKSNIINLNRGDKLLCFYTNVAFENIGFRAFFRAFCFAILHILSHTNDSHYDLRIRGIDNSYSKKTRLNVGCSKSNRSRSFF